MTEKFPKEHEITFLENDKVKLCIPTKVHLPYFTRWFNDPEVTQFLGDTFPVLEAAEERWLKNLSKNQQQVTFVIHTKESIPIGTMGLHRINYLHGTAATEAAIGEKKYWGKGYGSAAKILLLRWAFLDLNLYVIRSGVFAFNERSAAYNKKCGYKEIGILPGWRVRNGKRHDEIIMAVTREDFLATLE